MSSDPLKEIEDTLKDPIGSIEDIPSDVNRAIGEGKRLIEDIFDPPTAPLPELEDEEPELPKREDVISDILGQQLKTIQRRRRNRTLTTGPRGVLASAPRASTVLFGS